MRAASKSATLPLAVNATATVYRVTSAAPGESGGGDGGGTHATSSTYAATGSATFPLHTRFGSIAKPV